MCVRGLSMNAIIKQIFRPCVNISCCVSKRYFLQTKLYRTAIESMKPTIVAESLKTKVTLNDGVEMPMFGLGVWRTEPGSPTENAVLTALNAGYILIDTADLYKNERDVGEALKKSGLRREDIFVVSKLWGSDHGYEKAKKGAMESYKKLGLDYIDLYLIHAPQSDKLVDTYKALQEVKQQGLIRSIGVSNFGIQHIEGLMKAGLPAPSVNQIELHVWQHKKDIVDYCRQQGIAVMGFSPLAKGKRMEDPEIQKMAQKYNKSYGQVMIRWSVQKGFITIPKSGRSERIKENAQVFDWSLDDEDMDKIDNFEQWNCAWNPTLDPFRG